MFTKSQYLFYIGLLCAVLAVFTAVLMIFGFRAPSVGKVMTTICLVVAAVLIFRASNKAKHTPEKNQSI